jgi:hypothetical protein
MPALAIAAISLQALGMISDFIGANKAGKAAKKAARAEGIAESKVTAERIRQLHLEERVMKGQTIAAAAGSNVKVDKGSPLQILAEQAKEFANERRITGEVGATKAAAAMRSGRNVSNAYRYQAGSNIAQGASNIFSIMHQSGMFSKGKSNYGPPT